MKRQRLWLLSNCRQRQKELNVLCWTYSVHGRDRFLLTTLATTICTSCCGIYAPTTVFPFALISLAGTLYAPFALVFCREFPRSVYFFYPFLDPPSIHNFILVPTESVGSHLVTRGVLFAYRTKPCPHPSHNVLFASIFRSRRTSHRLLAFRIAPQPPTTPFRAHSTILLPCPTQLQRHGRPSPPAHPVRRRLRSTSLAPLCWVKAAGPPLSRATWPMSSTKSSPDSRLWTAARGHEHQHQHQHPSRVERCLQLHLTTGTDVCPCNLVYALSEAAQAS